MAQINSIEELRRAQAAGNANGQSVTNYAEWMKILIELNEAGIKPTGNFDLDRKLRDQYTQQKQNQVQDLIDQNIPQIDANKKIQPQHNEMAKIDSKTVNDEEQRIKAEVANQTSSTANGDYWKYYHLMG